MFSSSASFLRWFLFLLGAFVGFQSGGDGGRAEEAGTIGIMAFVLRLGEVSSGVEDSGSGMRSGGEEWRGGN